MRTLRLSLAGMVILVLLGGLPAAVLAQADDADAGSVTVVTGTDPCHVTTPGTTTLDEDGAERYRGHISTCQPDTSDPRMNMPYEMVWETDCYPDGRCMMWGSTKTIDPGPDGWQGRFMGWVDATGVTSAVGISEGYGAYEGLTSISGGYGGDLSGANTGHRSALRPARRGRAAANAAPRGLEAHSPGSTTRLRGESRGPGRLAIPMGRC